MRHSDCPAPQTAPVGRERGAGAALIAERVSPGLFLVRRQGEVLGKTAMLLLDFGAVIPDRHPARLTRRNQLNRHHRFAAPRDHDRHAPDGSPFADFQVGFDAADQLLVGRATAAGPISGELAGCLRAKRARNRFSDGCPERTWRSSKLTCGARRNRRQDSWRGTGLHPRDGVDAASTRVWLTRFERISYRAGGRWVRRHLASTQPGARGHQV